VWYPNAERGAVRFGWANRDYSSLAEFTRTPLGQGTRYMSDGEKDSTLSAANVR